MQQDHKILFDRTALENVLLPLYIIGLNKNDAMERAMMAIEKVGLSGKEDKMPISFSGKKMIRQQAMLKAL